MRRRIFLHHKKDRVKWHQTALTKILANAGKVVKSAIFRFDDSSVKMKNIASCGRIDLTLFVNDRN